AAPAPRAAEATPAAAETATTTATAPLDAVETAIDMACALVEGAPAVAQALAEDAGEGVRDYCRERRRALSLLGKGALPAQSGGKATGANGQSIARQRRLEQSLKGRGDAPASRPSGRTRPAAEAPAKVETGTTLSGQAVTGTQVERTVKVTGNEPGSCRAITGTEYIGAEQFESFCASRPAPAPAKVGASATGRGLTVSGPEVGRSAKVTGGEAGTCKPVTGTEYLGSENFDEFCAGKGLTSRPEKVAMGATARKGLAVTGSDEARPVVVTGAEAGAKRGITGSQYNDAGVSHLTINGPAKVALTHTIAGRPVSGTEVGRSVKVTGDEAGACHAISGTEYLSNEQFKSVCHTRPEAGPEKVGATASEGGQRITGNLVERTGKVTGNEPRAEGRVTGSQYERGAARGEAPAKVRELRTPAGRRLTGGVMSGTGSPKLSGDEQGGRQRVTGTDYAGAALSAAGPGAPESMTSAVKVDVTHTLRGQTVSGSPMGRSSLVTGDEPGSHLAISGTPYAASEQIAGACGCQHGEAAEPAGLPQAHPRFQPQGRPRAMAMSMVPAEPRPESFSVSAPAREARGRITGTGYGGAGRITGPVNMASGLVSGTPEFRYRDEAGLMAGMGQAMAESATPAAQGERITGEGREAGRRITGDDWGRSDLVTGTEGRWAQGRNPTLRGTGRGIASGAWANKGIERPEAPIAKVTGSSGNAGKGAVITVSGGARG
ncbi:MAG TPA: CsoS2 family carboxysome shell protein, partial [Thiobacillaceae bacterium]|nr:CsoS2 family carboxysome shell protein [Thiobacillaceae bacterium]